MKQLSNLQKAKNRKKFGCENLKVPLEVALDKMVAVARAFNSKLSTRKKLDILITYYEEILTDDIVIIKCPISPNIIGSPSRKILGSDISFVVGENDTQQIWIPFDEWDKLGSDFEEKYKEYIDWELINRYQACKKGGKV
jgi:hypothetical protein